MLTEGIPIYIDVIILVMRWVFGKYLALFLAGIIIQVIVIITVLIKTFGYTNDLARWLFDIINNWTVSLYIFRFIADWAAVLSALAVCLVFLTLLADFRKYRRNRSLGRLHNWAKNAVLTLAEYRWGDSGLQDSPLGRYEEIRTLVDRLKANCRAVLADAQVLGGELDANTQEAVSILFTVDEKVEKQDASAFEDLRTLRHNLADIMISAFESLQNERDTRLLFQRNRSR